MNDQRKMEEEREKRGELSREMLAMLDEIAELVKQIVVAANQAALYAVDHPAVKEYTDRAFTTVSGILKHKAEIAITVREGLLVYENVPLYKLSTNSNKFINLLELREIGGLVIRRGVQSDEIVQMVDVLVSLPEELESIEDISDELARRGVGSIGILEPAREAKEKQAARTPKQIYREAVRTMRRVTRAVMKGKAPSMEEVNSLAGEMTRVVLKDRRTLIALTSIKDFDDNTFTHSVNVCVLATALASIFIRDNRRLSELAQAALLHDVGKIVLPHTIIEKKGPLGQKDSDMMEQHPATGARILEETEGVNPLSKVVAFEHHMGYDMSGYPRLDALEHPHPMSLMVQIANEYDKRLYDPARGVKNTPEAVLAEMASGAGDRYEPRMVKEFINMMGLYPPGTVVELVSGEIAIVDTVSAEDPLRPVVRIVRGPDGEEPGEIVRVDCGAKDGETGKYLCSIIRSLEAEEAGIDMMSLLE